MLKATSGQMIRKILLEVDTDKMVEFLDKTGGGEDFTGVLGLFIGEESWAVLFDNGVKVLSVQDERPEVSG